MLIIEVNDEKKETKRKVLEERIKRGQLRLEISIEPKYDLDNLKATVANGLLTVTVPLKAKPEEVEKQYTIE
jgi:HSP20 family molecular chaperone IbpA